MNKQVLTDPLVPPTTALLKDVMHNNYANLEQVLEALNKQGVITEWKYYKDGKSWLAKAQYKKKTIVWISVWENCFKLSFFFNHKTRDGINNLELNAAIKENFSKQQPAGKLTPLILEIQDNSMFKHIEEILEYKIKCT